MKAQLCQLYTLLSATDPQLAHYLNKHDSGNMFFCFRWLLVLFKREFNAVDIMKLWEILWTDLPCKNFHLLFLCSYFGYRTKYSYGKSLWINRNIKGNIKF